MIIGEWQKPLGAAYRAHLRAEVTQRLGWGWTPLDSRGLSELAGWSPSVLSEMSQRRRQLTRHLEEAWGTSEGLTGYQTRAAAVATRAVKSPAGALVELQADWRARLSEHGLAASVLDRLVAPLELRAGAIAYAWVKIPSSSYLATSSMLLRRVRAEFSSCGFTLRVNAGAMVLRNADSRKPHT